MKLSRYQIPCNMKHILLIHTRTLAKRAVRGSTPCFLIAALLFMVTLSASAQNTLSERTRAAISERIAPVTKICQQGESCAKTRPALQTAAVGERTGDQIYQTVCSTCHDTGAGGAAKLDESEKWTAKRAARTLSQIYQSAIGGRNAMPARGSCVDCTDEEIKRTVDYMLERVSTLSR